MKIEIGQIWMDKDKRRNGREFVITNIGRGELEGTEPYVLVRQMGKEGYLLIRKDRLLSHRYQFTGEMINARIEKTKGNTGNNDISKTEAVHREPVR